MRIRPRLAVPVVFGVGLLTLTGCRGGAWGSTLARALSVHVGRWLVQLGIVREGTMFDIAHAILGVVFLFFAALGAGFFNITLALVLLAIPPILLNAYAGVRAVDPEAVDAARGMGLTGRQIFGKVELPLALPLIFGGIKTSTVNVLATATIAPLVGVLTLGDPIISGSVHGRVGQIGASIVVALLAVLAELVLSALQRAVTPTGVKLERSAPASHASRLGTLKRRIQTVP